MGHFGKLCMEVVEMETVVMMTKQSPTVSSMQNYEDSIDNSYKMSKQEKKL